MVDRPAAFDLEGYLSPRRERVERALAERMDGLTQSVPPRLLESMRYSLLAGGKRLRPLLVLAFAEAVARQSNGGGRAAEDAACAVEMIHTYSLIHDDLPAMDDDDMRRGRPTNHKVFGEAMAILAGDALLTEAFVQASAGAEPFRLALVRELSVGAGAAGMVGGQVWDIAEDRPAEEAYLIRLHRGKTGALIRASCRMGAIAGGAKPSELEAAEVYGDAVGLAFQIADDILDVEGDPSKMGKPTGADAEAHRFTFPAVLGMERSKTMARDLVQKAVAAVQQFEGTDGPLAALARYSVERSN